MTIGLLTEPESYKRRYFFKRLLGLCSYQKIPNPKRDFDISAKILPYSIKSLEKMPASRLEKLIQKKINFYNKNGITKLILSDYLYGLCKQKSISTKLFINGKGKKLFLTLMPLCLRQTTKKLGIDLFSATVCIMDSKMDRISEYLMHRLCFDTKKMYLFTENTPKATAFCELFCDETGLWIDVCDRQSHNFDILLDIDNCQIKIGRDLYIRDAKLGFDLSCFKVSELDIASVLPLYDLSDASWIYSYQK